MTKGNNLLSLTFLFRACYFMNNACKSKVLSVNRHTLAAVHPSSFHHISVSSFEYPFCRSACPKVKIKHLNQSVQRTVTEKRYTDRSLYVGAFNVCVSIWRVARSPRIALTRVCSSNEIHTKAWGKRGSKSGKCLFLRGSVTNVYCLVKFLYHRCNLSVLFV